jgi:GYF domain 2
MQLFISIILWLMIGSATAYFANQRGRDPFVWFMLGMLLGFLGLLLLFLLPVGQEEKQAVEAEYSLLESKEKIHLTSPLQPLAKDWYYYDESRCQQGPIDLAKLRQLWSTQQIKKETYLWSAGMSEWKKMYEINDFYEWLQ